MSKASAVKVVHAVFQSSLRAYAYAGKRSWSGPLAEGGLKAAEWELEALSASKPALAEHYRQTAALARQVFARGAPARGK